MIHLVLIALFVLVKSEVEKEELFWLIFGLWQGKVFRPNIIGSAIPFIRKKEIEETITFGISKLVKKP